MSTATFAVQAESLSNTHTLAHAREFSFHLDEPGTTNLGPTPVEYLLGGLAGCMCVVGRLAASEMGFEIRSLNMELEGSINPMVFLGKEKRDRPGMNTIQIKLQVETDAGTETLAKWVEEIESRCPVGDNIRNTTTLEVICEKK